MAKYVFVTGGVASGLGKGIIAASLGRLLKARGLQVALLKLDPYFNMDSSFISPKEHGEVFVTEDGMETDLAVGHYERIFGGDMTARNAVTSGRIYSAVMKKERAGAYAETVQIVPHITDEIKNCISALDDGKTDIILTEIGGTVGDIECAPFLEAIRQMQTEIGRRNVAYVHVTLVPFIEMSREQKTKPTQRSVKELQDIGIQPDAIVCRSDYPIMSESKRKLAQFCNISGDGIITSLTGDEIYEMPPNLEKEGLSAAVLKKLGLTTPAPDLAAWQAFRERAERAKAETGRVRIAIVGKYKPLAYASVCEALFYSAIAASKMPETAFIASDGITPDNAAETLKGFDGIVVCPGFGDRGFDGKVAACEYARKHNIPALMIGLGAQAAVCGFLRGVCGVMDAYSAEFDASQGESAAIRRAVKDGAPDFVLGARESKLLSGTRLSGIYGGAKTILERHRHKYEINPAYRQLLERNGLTVCAENSAGVPEAFELKDHVFFAGVTFRPEFKARPDAEHPLFCAFIKACG